ncbi:MAG: signal peptide peptidase SppA [Kiritimatiellae bacterium]|nr:signal peptide peptidase SppA [Kiritimatiellia bacterium]
MSENLERSKKGRGCGFGCALMLGLLIGVGLLFAVVLVGGLKVMNLPPDNAVAGLLGQKHRACDVGEDEAPYMVEKWSYGTGTVKVIRVPISGMIMLGESSWYVGNANTVLRSIRRATHDPEVMGLILEINSGGGGITDSDIIYKALLDFKARQDGRAVVTIMGDVAASGAYYIALASDHILAHPTTITGSIGVIMQSYNIKELAQKLGIHDVTIKSGDNKDMLNPFRDVKPEQTEMLQTLISAMHERFVTLVAQHRGMEKAVVAPLADGRVFMAEEAVRCKLIDSIGYNEDAQRKIAELLETDAVKIYRYDEQISLMDLFSPQPGIGVKLDLDKLLRDSTGGTKLMYRWDW